MRRLLLAFMIAASFASEASAAKRVKKPEPVPVFSAKSFLVASEDGTIIQELEGDTVRPIASITKLMVSMLAAEQDMDEMLAIPAIRQVQTSIPRKTRELSRKDLLALALVKSDNFAAQILCSNIPNCIDRMNERAVSMGLKDTKFVEPTGLSQENVSTAHDLLKMVKSASTFEIIRSLSSQPKAEIPLGKQAIKVNNTNPLTSKFSIILSKTGFTNPAGGCLVMIMDSPVGQRILILLGSRNARTRIPDMENLIKKL